MVMRYRRALVIVLAAIMILVSAGCADTGKTKGRDLFEKAQSKQEQMEFAEAKKLYEQAKPLLIKENDTEKAAEARQNLQTIAVYEETYPYSAAEVEKLLAEGLPDVPKSKLKSWIEDGELEHITIDGKTSYFEQAYDNIPFRHMDIMWSLDNLQSSYQKFLVPFIENIVMSSPESKWQPFEKPNSYIGTGTLAVPRNELPDKGVLKLWFPVPITSGPQEPVSVVSVTPDNYIKQPPSTDRDIGLIYMEVPLDSLTTDLNIQIQFSFTHYEQRFTIDPENAGEYDEESYEYRQYTRSYGNTYITPDIKATARKVVGGEKNPYRAAHKIYDYILDNIDYSFMPHGIMWPRSEMRESVYVHENKRGDCGAQSMYFSALCRAVGIPARTTGGWQLLTDKFEDHFWAEFLLPNYGWLPVDPTVAEFAFYLKDLPDEDREAFKQFFFGNQDAMRCVTQEDVDVPLIPPAEELVLLPCAIQEPAALCDTMEEIPGELIDKHWTLDLQVVSKSRGNLW
ncbi:MAG: transglutaminase domain-containing protein [Actinobacteria bacterium]|nr:transglutaminase domain-containing protein [Actinomycetota bacterium]